MYQSMVAKEPKDRKFFINEDSKHPREQAFENINTRLINEWFKDNAKTSWAGPAVKDIEFYEYTAKQFVNRPGEKWKFAFEEAEIETGAKTFVAQIEVELKSLMNVQTGRLSIFNEKHITDSWTSGDRDVKLTIRGAIDEGAVEKPEYDEAVAKYEAEHGSESSTDDDSGSDSDYGSDSDEEDSGSDSDNESDSDEEDSGSDSDESDDSDEASDSDDDSDADSTFS